MHCDSCGTELPAGAEYCPICGVVTPYKISASGSSPYDLTAAASPLCYPTAKTSNRLRCTALWSAAESLRPIQPLWLAQFVRCSPASSSSSWHTDSPPLTRADRTSPATTYGPRGPDRTGSCGTGRRRSGLVATVQATLIAFTFCWHYSNVISSSSSNIDSCLPGNYPLHHLS